MRCYGVANNAAHRDDLFCRASPLLLEPMPDVPLFNTQSACSSCLSAHQGNGLLEINSHADKNTNTKYFVQQMGGKNTKIVVAQRVDNPEMSEIKDRVRSLRLEKDMTQADLAAKCGVRQQNIAQLEAGQVQNPRFLVDLAAVLDVSPYWLQTGKGERQGKAPTMQYASAVTRKKTWDIPEAESPSLQKAKRIRRAKLRSHKKPGAAHEVEAIEGAIKLIANSVSDLDSELKEDVISMIERFLKMPEPSNSYLRAISAIITSR